MRSDARSSSPEAQLLRHVRQIGEVRLAQRALLFHLSRLQKHHRRDKHLRIAANMLEELVNRFNGRLFLLQEGDLVVTCKGARQKTLEEAVEVIRYLFNDDPLARAETAPGVFCSLFDLEHDYDHFLALVRRLHDARQEAAGEVPAKREPGRGRERLVLDPKRLGEVLATINRADLSNLIRRQTVWSLVPGAAPQPIFDELFVSIEELGNALAPDYHITSDRWLFQYLTQALDRRVLSMLAREFPSLPRGLSLNINIATVLSPDFLRFEDYLPVRARGNLILELQLADMWADFGAYLFAANLMKQREYRMCLDAVRHTALPFVDTARLELDFLKLVWDDALLSLDAEEKRRLHRLVADCGKTRVILMHCDSPEAVAFGQAAGIKLFQGWHTDRQPSQR